jgi:hypothetical protein
MSCWAGASIHSEENAMTLAHVVYNISNDSDMAALWRSDPKAALAKMGFQLSQEELEFLSSGLKRTDEASDRFVNIRDLPDSTGWK